MASPDGTTKSMIKTETEEIIETAVNQGDPTSKRQKIDKEDLSPLSWKHAIKAQYPPGCPVWYDFTPSSTRLDACHGVVESVHMNVETADRVYKVTKSIDGTHDFFSPDQIAYAMDCPVKVKGIITDEPDKELDATILCPLPGKEDGKLSYSVRFSLEGKRVRVELGVESDHVSYRQVLDKGRGCKTDNNLNGSNEAVKKLAEEHTGVLWDKKTTGVYSSTLQASSRHGSNWNEKSSLAETDYTYAPSNTAIGHNKETYDKRGTPLGTTYRVGDTNSTQEHMNKIDKRQWDFQTTNGHISDRLHHEPHGEAKRSKQQHKNYQPQQTQTQPKEHCSSPNTWGRNRLPPTAGQTNGANLLPIVTSKAGHDIIPSLKQLPEAGDTRAPLPSWRAPLGVPPPGAAPKPLLSRGGNDKAQVSNRQQGAPPIEDSSQKHLPDIHDVYCMLTVPSWVTSSSRRSIFFHIIGKDDRGQGYKTREIERVTGCVVTISRTMPVSITIKPMWQGNRYDLMKAREMVEDSLLEFLYCNGAKSKLLYELALSFEKARLQSLEGHIIQQRNLRTNEKVWMNLMDINTLQKRDLLSLTEDMQTEFKHETQFSVEIFGQDLNNLNLPVGLCKPFALICGQSKEYAKRATRLVSDAINKCRQYSSTTNEFAQSATPSSSFVPLGKRKPDVDAALSARRYDRDTTERPTKLLKDGGNKNRSSQNLEHGREASCILTVPFWVIRNLTEQNELYDHILGEYSNRRLGRRVKFISIQTRCTIGLSERNVKPMTIKIKANDGCSFHAVRKAKQMIQESLFDFLDDANSERRLIHELATTATGTFVFQQSGGAIQLECHISHHLVWMRLLELPSAERDGKPRPHGRYLLSDRTQQSLLGSTNCSIEVYCFNKRIPRLSGPYVLVFGNNPGEVNEVTNRVAGEIDHYMREYIHCKSP